MQHYLKFVAVRNAPSIIGMKNKAKQDAVKSGSRRLLFKAGCKYKIRTQTVSVTRTVEKPGMDGLPHEHHLAGVELAIFLTDELGVERCFLDKRLAELGAKVEGEVEKQGAGEYKYTTTQEMTADFDLQTLVNRFVVPAAPDVAQANPEGYRANLQFLDELENIVNNAN
jgi:hypothetical protein